MTADTTAVNLEGSSGVTIRQFSAATLRRGELSVASVYAAFIHRRQLGGAFNKGPVFKRSRAVAQSVMLIPLMAIFVWVLGKVDIVWYQTVWTDAMHGYAIFDAQDDDGRMIVVEP